MPPTIVLGQDPEYNLILKVSTGSRLWLPIPGTTFEKQIRKPGSDGRRRLRGLI